MHTQTTKHKKNALLSALTAAMLFSTAPVCGKFILKRIDPYSTMLITSTLAYIAMSLLLIFKNGFKHSFKNDRKTYLFIGIFFIFVQVIPGLIWFNVLPKLQALFAIMLKRTQPIMVLFLSILLGRKKPKMAELCLSVVAIFGMYYILSSGNSSTPLQSNLIYTAGAIVCVALWALMFIFSSTIFKDFSALEANRIGFGTYAMIMIPIVYLFGTPSSILNLESERLLYTILSLLYLGVAVLGFGVALIFSALKTLEPWNVSMIMLSGPIAGAIAASTILGEIITRQQLAGSIIVLGAMFLSILVSKKSSRLNPETLKQL